MSAKQKKYRVITNAVIRHVESLVVRYLESLESLESKNAKVNIDCGVLDRHDAYRIGRLFLAVANIGPGMTRGILWRDKPDKIYFTDPQYPYGDKIYLWNTAEPYVLCLAPGKLGIDLNVQAFWWCKVCQTTFRLSLPDTDSWASAARGVYLQLQLRDWIAKIQREVGCVNCRKNAA